MLLAIDMEIRSTAMGLFDETSWCSRGACPPTALYTADEIHVRLMGF